jgi:hypothetical protein
MWETTCLKSNSILKPLTTKIDEEEETRNINKKAKATRLSLKPTIPHPQRPHYLHDNI